MRKHPHFVFTTLSKIATIVTLVLACAACDNGTADNTVSFAPLVITGKDSQLKKVEVTFTSGREAPEEGAPLTEIRTGDSYVITLDGEVLSEGKITVSPSGAVTFTPEQGEPFYGSYIARVLRFSSGPLNGFVQDGTQSSGTPSGGGGGVTSFTVTFNANGGTAVPPSATAPLDGTGPVSPSVATRAGYEFAGWYSDTDLTILDVSGNPALEWLNCSGTGLTSLNVSGNPALQTLNCNNTGITSLDINENPALQTLNCNNTGLTSLDVSENTALQSLICHSNPNLTSLDLSGAPALEYLQCSGNLNLTSLNVSGNPALQRLYCYSTGLTSLDVSGNPALQELYCDNTGLTSLDVCKNLALQILHCNTTNLTNLDVSKNLELKYLNCLNTGLTSLDVSGNPALQLLICQNAHMDKNALEALFRSLCDGDGALACYGNPGYGTADKAIATAKGWSVD